MTHDETSGGESLFLLRMRLIAKITLIVSAVSCLGILLVLTFITDDSGTSYGTIIRSHSKSRQHLAPALLAAGLFLVLFAVVITRLISNRTSLYIAGPLYRFARNLETFIKQGPITLVPTRQKDCLKQEEQQIKRSIGKLQAHYDTMLTTTAAALGQIDSQQNPAATIAQLKELDRATRL